MTSPVYLLTPGPLTTSDETRAAATRDFGSRDETFIGINRRMREGIIEVAGRNPADYVCVPLQGSGTFTVEAMIGTFVPADGKLLVLVNGAYGRRMLQICEAIGRQAVAQMTSEEVPVSAEDLERTLADDPEITHVAVIHCETTTGLLNPVGPIAEVVAAHGRRLLIDSMSAFGALPLEDGVVYDALAASSNKCLEGIPGLGFTVARKAALSECAGNAPSLSLDLHAQWAYMERTAQWRFTPPIQVIAALGVAIEQHREEGGVAGRGARYRRNCQVLVEAMRGLGFATLLPDELQAPIIVTFHVPDDPNFDFERFYNDLKDRGFVIYPGKLTTAETFRIGCIGALDETVMQRAVGAIEATLKDMGVAQCHPRIQT